MKHIILISLALFSLSLAAAGKPCATTGFQTKMYADACKKGGQDEAKKAAKAFIKKVASKSGEATNCNVCHMKVGGDYPRKPNALALYKKLGGM